MDDSFRSTFSLHLSKVDTKKPVRDVIAPSRPAENEESQGARSMNAAYKSFLGSGYAFSKICFCTACWKHSNGGFINTTSNRFGKDIDECKIHVLHPRQKVVAVAVPHPVGSVTRSNPAARLQYEGLGPLPETHALAWNVAAVGFLRLLRQTELAKAKERLLFFPFFSGPITRHAPAILHRS